MSVHLPKKEIKVTGHLEDKRGIYQMALSWYDNSGKRIRKSTSTGLTIKGNKKRAEELLQEACKTQEKILAETPDTDTLLYADFMEEWLDVIRHEVKLNTFGGYQDNVKRVIAPYFRNTGVLLRDLTADDINEFYAAQLKRVSANTIIGYHRNISKAMKYAVEKNLMAHSVMERVKRPKTKKFVGSFLNPSEAVRMMDAVKGHKLELGVILGAFYGLRREEVLGLKWSAINFENNTITIEHTVTQTKVDGKRVIVADDTTKTKSSHRTLPLVPAVRAKLLDIREEQERNKKLCGRSYNKAQSDYVYTDPLGNLVKPDYLSSAFPRFMVEHGFKRLRFHDLRHPYVKSALKRECQRNCVNGMNLQCSGYNANGFTNA